MGHRGPRLPLLLLFGLVTAIVVPRPCLACSCVATDPPQQLALSDVVVRGRVVEVAALSRWQRYLPWHWDNPDRTVGRLLVETVWKGTAQSEVAIEGGDSWGDCSITLSPGVEYIVYGQRRGDEPLATNSCLGTISTDHVAETAAALAALGPGTPMASPPRPNAPASAGTVDDRMPALLGGLVGGTAIAALAVRRRRSAGGPPARRG